MTENEFEGNETMCLTCGVIGDDSVSMFRECSLGFLPRDPLDHLTEDGQQLTMEF